MKLTLLTTCLLFGLSVSGQNLVLNPGFELYSECPSSIDNGNGTYFPCIDWSSARYSPEYFNTCAIISQAGVPDNLSGHQPAFDGNAYVGIFAYNKLGSGNSQSDNYNEFILADIPALEVDSEYIATMHVSATVSTLNSQYAVDGFGMFFNTYGQPPANINMQVIPQIDYSNYGVISDTVNWVTLTDTFTADSAYTHLIIGDFKTPATINKTVIGTDSTSHRAYYYIDGISVVKRSQAHLLNILTPAIVGINIYPNPATTQIVVTASERIRKLTIENVEGQVLYTQYGNSDKVAVDITDFPNGLYFLRINDNHIRQFIKR